MGNTAGLTLKDSKFDSIDECNDLMDQQDFRGFKDHFARLLADLQENRGENWQFLRVYRGLTIAELNLSFGRITMNEKMHRLQNAALYNDKACLITRNLVNARRELALARLQRAVVNGRMTQLQVVEGNSTDGTMRDWKSATQRSINSALAEMRSSNHERFEESQKWADEWLQILR